MKHMMYKCLVLLLCVQAYVRVLATSIVFNFRIAQITKQPIVDQPTSNAADKSVIGLFFDQHQKKYTGDIHQHFTGLMGSFIYNFTPYYVRVDGAVSHITALTDQVTTFSGTKTDDILLTLGRDFEPNEHTRITLSGLTSIPTHHIFTLQHIDFGYGQFSGGIQLDGSYEVQDRVDLLFGTRYIHFIPRTAYNDVQNQYIFSIGNVADILFGMKKNWEHHGLEGGYTARWGFGANIFPDYDDIVAKTNYVRNNFYFVYKYKFTINNIHNRISTNISYGFDSRPQNFGNKYIVTFWAAWNVNF